MTTSDATPLTGGCLCGALRYEVKGPILYSGLCHCLDCQKSTGSAFAAYMGVDSKELVLTGAYKSYDHALSDGRLSRRNFCPTCGSTVFGGYPTTGTPTLYAGTLDDSSRFIPNNQIYTCVRRAWAHVPLGTLPEFEQMP